MKNFSAPKLLRMTLTGAHINNCPHANNKLPGYECLCWKNEVRKWDTRTKLSSSQRVRKAKPQKVHLAGYKCSAKSPLSTSINISDITCQQCLKHANRPPKPVKVSRKKNKST